MEGGIMYDAMAYERGKSGREGITNIKFSLGLQLR